MVNVKDKHLGMFYKDGLSYFILIKPPFSISSLEKGNPIYYQLFTLWELKDTGILIGYLIEPKQDIPITYSHNFILIGKMSSSNKVNVLLNNKNIKIFEDEKLQNVLIIGDRYEQQHS